jgi:hypothetical protein
VRSHFKHSVKHSVERVDGEVADHLAGVEDFMLARPSVSDDDPN